MRPGRGGGGSCVKDLPRPAVMIRGEDAGRGPAIPSTRGTKHSGRSEERAMKIDPKQRGDLPRVDEPSPFVSPDGRFRGWSVSIPGRRSLATPAVVDGRVFMGGGFGSYD